VLVCASLSRQSKWFSTSLLTPEVLVQLNGISWESSSSTSGLGNLRFINTLAFSITRLGHVSQYRLKLRVFRLVIFGDISTSGKKYATTPLTPVFAMNIAQ
jgi:hypothetical protein